MKNSKFYVIGSVCLIMATVVLLFVAVYVVPSLAPPLLPHQAQAATTVDPRMTEDPLVAVNYRLELEEKLVGYFTEVSGIGSESEVVEHKVVDDQGNPIVQKIPGRLEWTNVVLKRGVTSNMQLWEWRRLVEEGKVQDARKNVSITMMDQNYQDVAQWEFTDAWPCRITAPDFYSNSNDIAVEEIEIVSEGMLRVN